MSLYKRIKAAVTARMAAENFGLTVDHSGMARCPFHDDHHPSLKLDRRYYCFGCGEKGDVIDFVAKYLGISKYSAALQLARDFGIDPRPPIQMHIPKPNAETLPKKELPCILSLSREIQKLRRWKREYAPKKPGEPWDPRFVKACREEAYAEYRLDCALGLECSA